eukprot:Nk52_evm14s123 gene=Nk52_evmTU14s123
MKQNSGCSYKLFKAACKDYRSEGECACTGDYSPCRRSVDINDMTESEGLLWAMGEAAVDTGKGSENDAAVAPGECAKELVEEQEECEEGQGSQRKSMKEENVNDTSILQRNPIDLANGSDEGLASSCSCDSVGSEEQFGSAYLGPDGDVVGDLDAHSRDLKNSEPEAAMGKKATHLSTDSIIKDAKEHKKKRSFSQKIGISSLLHNFKNLTSHKDTKHDHLGRGSVSESLVRSTSAEGVVSKQEGSNFLAPKLPSHRRSRSAEIEKKVSVFDSSDQQQQQDFHACRSGICSRFQSPRKDSLKTILADVTQSSSRAELLNISDEFDMYSELLTSTVSELKASLEDEGQISRGANKRIALLSLISEKMAIDGKKTAELVRLREESWIGKFEVEFGISSDLERKYFESQKKVCALEKQLEEEKRKWDELKVRAVSSQLGQHYLAPAEPRRESIWDEDEFFDAVEYTQEVSDLKTVKPRHRFFNAVEAKVQEMLSFAKESVEGDKWTKVLENGALSIYRKEVVKNGITSDSVRAFNLYEGVTGREFSDYFYDPDFRFEWEDILETCEVLERLDDSTVILHQVYKKMPLSDQREVVFVSHQRQLEDGSCIIVNFSVEHPGVKKTRCVRAICNTAIYTENVINANEAMTHGDILKTQNNISRSQVQCKLVYMGNVNPGGWVPASFVSRLSRFEYPKMLKRAYDGASTHFKNLPICF